MDSEPPASTLNALDVDGVIEIPRVIRINCDDKLVSQVLAPGEHFLAHGLGDLLRFIQDRPRKLRRKMILPNDRKHVHARRRARTEIFYDLPFRIDVARFPSLQLDDDLVPAIWNPGQWRVRRDLDVNVVHDAGIVRHDVEEIFRLLERPDDRVVRPFQDANHPAFRPVAPAFRPSVRHVTRDPRDHFIAVHRGAGVLRRDEKVLFARLLARKESVASLVNMQCAGNEIGLRGQHITVFADARDLSRLFHLPQQGVQTHLHSALSAKRFSQLDVIERPIFRGPQQTEDLFADLLLLIVGVHGAEAVTLHEKGVGRNLGHFDRIRDAL
jgi:hypothetical protein